MAHCLSCTLLHLDCLPVCSPRGDFYPDGYLSTRFESANLSIPVPVFLSSVGAPFVFSLRPHKPLTSDTICPDPVLLLVASSLLRHNLSVRRYDIVTTFREFLIILTSGTVTRVSSRMVLIRLSVAAHRARTLLRILLVLVHTACPESSCFLRLRALYLSGS